MSGTPLTMLDMLRAQIERHIEHLKRLDVELAAMEASSTSLLTPTVRKTFERMVDMLRNKLREMVEEFEGKG